MKIIQIYCNKENFKTVKFKEKFNLVVGRIKHEKNLEKDSHNLGKTSLIEIIDFLLLKEIDKNHFLKNGKFNDYIFYIEIMLNDGGYVTIKRSVDKNTKISIKLHGEKYQNFTNNTSWDYENLALTSKFDEENPKKILNKLLGFDVLTEYDYRQTINYFLRTQSDYSDVFRLSKFKGKDVDWKPLLFELLGFKKENIIKKYELEEIKKEEEKKIKEIEQEFSINVEEIDKINGLIQMKEDEKTEKIMTIDRFDFYLKERGLNKQLIEELEQEISKLNTLEYDLKYDINKINDSLETNNTFDINETIEIFNEVKIFFDSQLKRSYEELVEFNKRITNERKKHLNEVLEEKTKDLEAVEIKLQDLNLKRMEIMEVLREKDSFQKFKKYQYDLIEIEKEIERLKLQLENIDIVKKQRTELETIKSDIKKVTEKIENEVNNSNELYKSIRKDYYNFLKRIIFKPGILSIKINTNGNVEFKAEIANDNNELTSEDKGFSYKKILCACFDIALLTNYYNKSFFRFIYHDGCLESLDPRKRVKYLEMIEEICDKYDIQYILTLIDSDIPMVNGKKYLFKNVNVAVELSDDDDNTGKLFGFAF